MRDDRTLSDPSRSPLPNSASWSERFASRYQCALPHALADWLDQELWKSEGGGEYREPADIEELLESAPEPIWPGLMCSDFIPLIHNAAGDWLCVRVDQENRASQIVQWYHGGGDWIPWGNDLSEAFIFDALIDRISPQSRRHAVPAESPRLAAGSSQDPMLEWALNHVDDSVRGLFQESAEPSWIAETLLKSNVAEVAVQCELVLLALRHRSRETLRNALGRRANEVSHRQLTEWAFDLDRIPQEYRSDLESELGQQLSGQDWNIAASHAESASRLSPELAWPWEILGYCAERTGDLAKATDAYRTAMHCSVFTDQSVRFNTHWESDHSAKFSVARLASLMPEMLDSDDYFRQLREADPATRRETITRHWIQIASDALARGCHEDALRSFLAAGWDIGAEPITTFADLLDSISAAAHSCGHRARAEVAATHRRCLKQRYGL